jgi:beta-hydroxyacyl-ACP dehydratase FabZ
MNETSIDIKAFLSFLPHRYPFILVDRVLEYSPKHVKAIKNVSFNEEFFSGHFPDNPVMPGVLQLEALAQASCFITYEEFGGKPPDVFFMGIEGVRFRKIVIPGDQLLMESNLVKRKKSFFWCDTKATVDGELACEASFSAMIRVKQ